MPRPKKQPEASQEDKKVLLRVPDAWHEWLRRRAFEERTPVAELVRKALEAAYPDLPKREEPEEDAGRKGAVVFPQGGTPALVMRDRQR